MHSHRIEMVLEHDVPLPKCLQIPHTTGRFNIVQCRQAFATLTTLLREWSSFILIEGLSYVKLLGKLVLYLFKSLCLLILFLLNMCFK